MSKILKLKASSRAFKTYLPKDYPNYDYIKITAQGDDQRDSSTCAFDISDLTTSNQDSGRIWLGTDYIWDAKRRKFQINTNYDCQLTIEIIKYEEKK